MPKQHTVRGFMAGAMKKAGYTVESPTSHSLWQALLTSEDIDNVEVDLAADLYNPTQPGFFSAFMHGKHVARLRFHGNLEHLKFEIEGA